MLSRGERHAGVRLHCITVCALSLRFAPTKRRILKAVIYGHELVPSSLHGSMLSLKSRLQVLHIREVSASNLAPSFVS
jgi:hypothetical protein